MTLGGWSVAIGTVRSGTWRRVHEPGERDDVIVSTGYHVILAKMSVLQQQELIETHTNDSSSSALYS